jgi:hypothetical protein
MEDKFETAIKNAHNEYIKGAGNASAFYFSKWLYETYRIKVEKKSHQKYDPGPRFYEGPWYWDVTNVEDPELATMFKLRYG